jgi:hypothetical protein
VAFEEARSWLISAGIAVSSRRLNKHSLEYIEEIISAFYNYDRVHKEVLLCNDGWNDYFIALEGEKVVGAIGDG